MKLLALVQDVMVGLQLPRPTYAVGNPDPAVAQMLSALNSSADDLIGRYPNNRQLPGERWVRSATGTLKVAPTLDTDDILFDTGLIRAAMTWRWRDWNGLDYAEAFRQAEERLSRLANAYTRQKHDKVRF